MRTIKKRESAPARASKPVPHPRASDPKASRVRAYGVGLKAGCFPSDHEINEAIGVTCNDCELENLLQQYGG